MLIISALVVTIAILSIVNLFFTLHRSSKRAVDILTGGFWMIILAGLQLVYLGVAGVAFYFESTQLYLIGVGASLITSVVTTIISLERR